MALKAAGNLWLKQYYHLDRFSLTHTSYIGSKESIEVSANGIIEQTYGTRYAPAANTAVLHLEFSLKYDHLNLDFFKSVLEKISVPEIVEFIETSPSGKYARKIGFLYEFLTGKQLVVTRAVTGNYTDLLEDDKYITGITIKNAAGASIIIY